MHASLVVRLVSCIAGASARESSGEVSYLYCRGRVCASPVVRLVSCIAGGECMRAWW